MTKAERARRQHTRYVFLAREFGPDFSYDAMLKRQRGRCANPSCRAKLPGGPGRRFCVDHDHRWGWVRGLLCHPCNIALGMANDDRRVLLGLVEYLDDTRSIKTLGRHYEQRIRHKFGRRAR
jgi:hypothetical protein